jgi:hypothetical protein
MLLSTAPKLKRSITAPYPSNPCSEAKLIVADTRVDLTCEEFDDAQAP